MSNAVVGSHVVTPVDKIKMAAFAVLFAITGVGLWFLVLPDWIFNQSLYESGAIAVEYSVWWPPILIGSPFFLFIAYGFLLKILEKDREMQFQYVTNTAITFVLIAIVVRIFSGFAMESYLSGKDYSKCIYYTSPANFSPTAWVKSASYCIEQTGPVRKPLMEWLQELPNSGSGVTPAEVRTKAQEMLAAYEAGERFLD